MAASRMYQAYNLTEGRRWLHEHSTVTDRATKQETRASLMFMWNAANCMTMAPNIYHKVSWCMKQLQVCLHHLKWASVHPALK